MGRQQLEVEKPKKKSKQENRMLSEQQERFCKLVATGKDPMEAMLECYPSRRGYFKGNQQQLLNKLMSTERIERRLKELIVSIRNNEALGDLYDFNKGARLLVDMIEMAQKDIADKGTLTYNDHKIILNCVQELNKMYGFNIVDRNGNTGASVNVTFMQVEQPKEGVIIEAD